jgi:hypothetical protein
MMREKHVVSALIEKRARLAGEPRAKQTEIRKIKRAIEGVDLCIRMFKDDYQPETIEPKVQKPRHAWEGRRQPHCARNSSLDCGVFTAPELARLVLERMGKEPSEQAIDMLAKTIHSSFHRQKNPVVTYDRASSWPGKWRLLRPDEP